jgi:hypothetical protein
MPHSCLQMPVSVHFIQAFWCPAPLRGGPTLPLFCNLRPDKFRQVRLSFNRNRFGNDLEIRGSASASEPARESELHRGVTLQSKRKGCQCDGSLSTQRLRNRLTWGSVGLISAKWLRGRDLNPRPLGYEPNELPGCSTPQLDSNNEVALRQPLRPSRKSAKPHCPNSLSASAGSGRTRKSACPCDH